MKQPPNLSIAKQQDCYNRLGDVVETLNPRINSEVGFDFAPTSCHECDSSSSHFLRSAPKTLPLDPTAGYVSLVSRLQLFPCDDAVGAEADEGAPQPSSLRQRQRPSHGLQARPRRRKRSPYNKTEATTLPSTNMAAVGGYLEDNFPLVGTPCQVP